jgi:hypothetical protein
MSTNIVHQHGTNHIKLTAVAAHLAGDLVCEQGFFGTVQDDVAAGDVFTLLLDPTVNYPRVPSTLAIGVIVAAPATAQATTLPIAAIGAATGGAFAPATGGWIPFGKVIATGTATTAKIQHFNPNPFQVTMP